MPIKCYIKPNRSSPRPFTERDLQRIAKKVNEGGVPWTTIIGIMAVTGGFGYLFCFARRLVDLAQDLRNWVLDLVDLAGAITVLGYVLRVVVSGRGIPVLNAVVAILITILTATLVFLRRLQRRQQILKDAGTIKLVLDYLGEICDSAEAEIERLLSMGRGNEVSPRDLETLGGLPPDEIIN